MIYYIMKLPNDNYVAREMKGKFKTPGDRIDIQFYFNEQAFLDRVNELGINYSGTAKNKNIN